VPTSKQRRETARRRLERQIQRRQELAARRRRRTVVVASAVSVLLVLAAVWLVIAKVGRNDGSAAAASTPSSSATATPTASPEPTPSRPPKTTSGACKYAETNKTLTNPNGKDVGLPPDPARTPATGTVDLVLKTSVGGITLTLDRAAAPCHVQSFEFLAGKKFFDNTKCHRLTSGTIYVLQCGDPSGTGSGGPSYQIKDENLAKASYVRGAVAMANAGANTNGSQFFIVYKDSTTLPKNYTVVGKVSQGLDVVDQVAKAGSDNANGQGDGAPKKAVTIQTARIAA
jgi:peptidyl-prolyl cis-trans isomerase B (cyclophilin B)